MHIYATAPDGSTQVRDIEIDEKMEGVWADKLFREFETAKRKRKSQEKSWKRSVLAYRSRLMEEEIKNAERSAIDIPVIKTSSQQTEARLVNPLLQHDPIHTAKPRQAMFKDLAERYEEFIDYIIDKADWRKFLTLSARMGMVFSKVVVKIDWEIKQRHVRQMVEEEQPLLDESGLPRAIMGPNGMPTGGVEMEKVWAEKEMDVIDWQGAKPRIVPTERFYHPIPTDDLDSAPWLSEEIFLSKHDIRAFEKKGIYREGTAEKMSKTEGTGPDQGFSLSGHSEKDKDKDKVSEDELGPYRLLEFYTTESFLDPTKEDVDIIVTFEPESKTIARAVYNWRHEYQHGFVTWCYEEVPGDIDGISLAYQLEPVHRAISASVNQRLDYASKSLSKTLFSLTGDDLAEKCRNGEIPEGLVEVNSPGGDAGKMFYEWSPVQNYSQMDSIEQYIEKYGDKLSALNLANWGVQEISRPNATGQMALLEEGKQPLYQLLESFREYDAKVVKVMVALYRQYAPAGVEMYLESDPENAGMHMQMMKWPEGYWADNVIIETAVSSETMSKMVRRQEAMAWLDKFQQMIGTYMELATAATTPAPVAMMAEQLLTRLYELHKDMAREFDLDTRQMVDPKGAVDAGRTWQEAEQQYQMQLQQAGQYIQQLEQQLGIATGQPGPQRVGQGGGGPAQAAGGMG